MEITRKGHKYNTIYDWKYIGVIHDNFDKLYDLYISTFNCQHCAKPFKNTRDRHLDHNHDTGEFRLIVCQKCNANDSYIKYPNGYDKKEYNKEWGSQKITCDCGTVVCRGALARHKRRAKHTYWFMKNID